jgi:golgi-specific brefeldin A-resistance guanine nucleotide exchange factor 1
VPESLKNILLVMSSSGYLVPPSQDPTHEKLWVETWKRLNRFLPDLRKELDLDRPSHKGQPIESQVTPVTVKETTTT